MSTTIVIQVEQLRRHVTTGIGFDRHQAFRPSYLVLRGYLVDTKISETRLTMFVDKNIPLCRLNSTNTLVVPQHLSYRTDAAVYYPQGVEMLQAAGHLHKLPSAWSGRSFMHKLMHSPARVCWLPGYSAST